MDLIPCVTIQIQRAKGDCVIASLAMLINRSYEDVFAAAITNTHQKPHRAGMYNREIIAAAKRLGAKLVVKRTWDLETSTGLLVLDKINRKSDEFGQHMVLLRFGVIFDTDGTVWEPETHFAQHGFRPVSILVLATTGEE